MFDYVNEIINAFDKAEPKGGGTKSSAAPDDLFKVDEDREKLPPEKAVEFHNLVAKTLYATKRARPNTCTAIAFLMTRVQAPDKDDWNKLTHLMKYLRGTHTLPLILSANGTGILKWWVDAAFVRNLPTSGLDSGSSWLDGVNGILMQQEPDSPKQDYWNRRAIASLANTLITVVEPVPTPLLSSMLLLQL
jgi:hypothetical protein